MSTQELNEIYRKENKNFYQEKIVKPVCHEKAILVTGGSGYLGIYLLKNLVENYSEYTIYTIVRDINKLKKMAIQYQLGEEWLKHIHCIQGDINELSSKDFPDVQWVIHSAAVIHALKNLSYFWKDNVKTTKKIAHMYQKNKCYFISSLSVFVSSNQRGVHKPVSLENRSDLILWGGYAQSKYIGECIMSQYGHTNIRLGLLTPALKNPILGKGFLADFLDILKRTGGYPENFEEAEIDMTPVDWCCKQISEILFNKPTSKYYHIANPVPVKLSDFHRIFLSQKYTYEHWIKCCSDIKITKLHRILMEYAYFKTQSLQKYSRYKNVDVFQTTGHKYY